MDTQELVPAPRVPGKFSEVLSLDVYLRGCGQAQRWKRRPSKRNQIAIRNFLRLVFPAGFWDKDSMYDAFDFRNGEMTNYWYIGLAAEHASQTREVPRDEFLHLARAWNEVQIGMPQTPIYVGVHVDTPLRSLQDTLADWEGNFLVAMVNPIVRRDYTQDKPLVPWMTGRKFVLPAHVPIQQDFFDSEDALRSILEDGWRERFGHLKRVIDRYASNLQGMLKARPWYPKYPIPVEVFSREAANSIRTAYQRALKSTDNL